MNKWKPVYDDADAKAKAEADAKAKADADAKAAAERKFSQEDVNSMIAKSRNEDKERVKKMATQLEELREKSNLTEKERNDLTVQIEDLRTQVMTKEELSNREKKRLEEKLTREKQDFEIKSNQWKSRYETSLVARALSDAAIQNEAYNPLQLVALLQPMAQVVEQLVDDKPSGEFSVRLKFNDVDEKGKPIILDLSPSDALKRMKDLPEQYGNLFKAGIKPGLGSLNVGVGGSFDPKKITADNYPSIRKQLKQQGKL